jgi:tripartite-type tricarboxylate transporter receptor subunit TctC
MTEQRLQDCAAVVIGTAQDIGAACARTAVGAKAMVHAAGRPCAGERLPTQGVDNFEHTEVRHKSVIVAHTSRGAFMATRSVLLILLLAVLLGTAAAQTFPSRPITLVVGFPPGSTSDLIPRAVAPLLSESMGVPVMVENRPGATGAVGAAFVARAKPDGYTVMMAPTPVLAINQWVFRELAYNPEKDFVPIMNVAATPNLLVVHPSVPVKDLGGLIALAKRKPDMLSFASAGSGSTSHLCGELLNTMAGTKMVHIPYKGPALAHQDLLAGRVPMMCDNLSNVISHVQSGRLRAIVIASQSRHPKVPKIPTTRESGLPGLEAGIWYGFVAPMGTPRPVVDRLHAELMKTLRNPVVTERLTGLGLDIVGDTPEEFGKLITAEAARWRKIVEVSGARAD